MTYSQRMPLRICDITMFYPTSHPGGVKSYIQAKKTYCLESTEHLHATMVPNRHSAKHVLGREYLYEFKSPALPWNPSYRFLMSYGAIKSALHEFQPDVIEIGCPYVVPWLVRKAYKRPNSSVKRPLLVGFYHADFPRADIYPLLKKVSPKLGSWSERLAERYAVALYNRLDLCLVSSPVLKQRLIASGIKNVEAVPFGVDTSLFRPIQPPPAEGNRLRLLYVGRLSTDKGILPFIEVIHQLVRSGVDAELTVVGSGFLEERTRQAAQDASYIRFQPFISSREDLAAVYSSHDLLIVPNPNETFCLSALEAMACGTPVATLNGFGGIETLINEQTGFLLGDNIDAFVPFLRSINRTQLLGMRDNLRRHTVEHFSHAVRFNHLFKIYEKALT